MPFAFTSFITIAVRTGAAPSAGAVAAKLERLAAASRIPVALVASATVKLPTAVFAAPAPSVIVSVAVVPATATLASVPPLGTFASVHGAFPAVYDASVSENTAVTRSTLPLALMSSIVIVTRAGLAPSVGAAAANEDRLPAASRMPVALAESADREAADGGVCAHRRPRLIVSVATAPEVDTLESVPPLGTLASVHGAVSVEEASVSLNVTGT